jgi:3-methylcrotonyl-CoA carboxylase alpha subunit
VFTKILIANRGEIACRIARTARRLAVRTVAVYSDADAGVPHVRACDEAVRIGPAPARESYLNVEAVIAAARTTGAEAIHPGYGFLSENAAFAEACADAGLVFIGPPADAIRAMGSKSAAKASMAQAGVPLLPGYHGEEQGEARLAAEAARIGYPVLIKASAGGGGKGMRIVQQPQDFAEALAGCRREAASSFGDDRVLIERYLPSARHIEMQVFADGHGGCIHLFERDCSVQRRHQKVLEEAPAPGMTAERRAAMGEAAVAAARAVGYVGAGTIEFLAAPDGAFYFMEMNTRLQVEHPVTEMITGLDLVEWQLRVACGERLPLSQSDVHARGHAIEARLYAEDPDHGSLPGTGRLVHLAFPPASQHVRIDAGVEAGGEVTAWYDPMLAKLIVWDESREAALDRLQTALGATQVVGVPNNVAFLARVVRSPSFREARVDTALIERERATLFPARATPREAVMLAALARVTRDAAAVRKPGWPDPWNDASGWRMTGTGTQTLVVVDDGKPRRVEIETTGDGWTLRYGGASSRLLRRDEKSGRVTIVPHAGVEHVFLDGAEHRVTFADELAAEGTASADGALLAPMPGRVVAVLREPGPVDKDTPLLVLEAMKMEHTIRAPSRGVLKAHRFEVGDAVTLGVPLVDFEPTE